MTLQELLNADVAVIGAALRRGFAWWTGELAALVPPGLRPDAPGRRPLLEIAADGRLAMRARPGAALEAAPTAPPRLGPVDVALPPETVLRRDLDLPALGAADLRRTLALDLPRLTSLAPEEALWDAEPGEATGAGRRRVRLAATRRARAEPLLAHARDAGFTLRRIGVVENGDLRFDLAAAAPASRQATLWRATVCVLLVANLAALVGRDIARTHRLRAEVEAHHARVAVASAFRRRAQAERARRADLLVRRAAQEPLRIVNALTVALPPSQWVQRLEWNGRAARVAGFRRPGVDVVAALRTSPAFGEVRALSGAEGATSAGGAVAFDVAAEARPLPRQGSASDAPSEARP